MVTGVQAAEDKLCARGQLLHSAWIRFGVIDPAGEDQLLAIHPDRELPHVTVTGGGMTLAAALTSLASARGNARTK